MASPRSKFAMIRSGKLPLAGRMAISDTPASSDAREEQVRLPTPASPTAPHGASPLQAVLKALVPSTPTVALPASPASATSPKLHVESPSRKRHLPLMFTKSTDKKSPEKIDQKKSPAKTATKNNEELTPTAKTPQPPKQPAPPSSPSGKASTPRTILDEHEEKTDKHRWSPGKGLFRNRRRFTATTADDQIVLEVSPRSPGWWRYHVDGGPKQQPRGTTDSPTMDDLELVLRRTSIALYRVNTLCKSKAKGSPQIGPDETALQLCLKKHVNFGVYTVDEVTAVIQFFRSIDLDASNSVSWLELAAQKARLPASLQRMDLQAVFQELDSDNNGIITIEELLSVCFPLATRHQLCEMLKLDHATFVAGSCK